MVPLKLKKIFILCAQRDGWGDTAGSCVCVSRKDVLLCVRSLCSAYPHFSPLFSRGKSSERHHFKAHTATYAFPCQQSELTHSLAYLTQDLDSHRFSFPQLDPADFFFLLLHKLSCVCIAHCWMFTQDK